MLQGLDWTIPPLTTTHPHPLPSTTTHHQPKYIHHDPPRPTKIHHHSPPAKIYPPRPATIYHHPPPPTTTTYHHPPPAKIYPPLLTNTQKMNQHPAQAKIYSYITSFWHCFSSFFFFKMQYFFPWQRFCVIKFWSVSFSNSKFLLHFTIFKIC